MKLNHAVIVTPPGIVTPSGILLRDPELNNVKGESLKM